MIFKVPFFNIVCALCCCVLSEVRLKTNSSRKITYHHGLDRRQLREFKTCYENLGCINTTKEWYHNTYRPLNLEPLNRHTIRTEFILITKNNDQTKPLNYDTLTFKKQSIESSCYNKNNHLKILIHDFTSNGYTGWIKHLASSLINRRKSNVISVDWEAGAEPPFEQAIANARVVALEIVAFIGLLKNISALHEDSVHLIGHGVGAHIAGYVGTSINIAKITGLDPTGPFFEKLPPIVRLDPGDAAYVEVLHTDAFNSRSQGGLKTLGHADFYLNGANLQPGCNESSQFQKFTKVDRINLKEGQILPACSHKRAFKYYIESFESEDCEFTGVKCKSYKDFLAGKCTSCKGDQKNSTCATFDKANGVSLITSNTFYLNTKEDAPFCLNTYRVKIKLQDRSEAKKHQEGNFELIVLDNGGVMVNASDSNANTVHDFEAGKWHSFIYYASQPRVKEVFEARLKWVHKTNSLCLAFCNMAVFVERIQITFLSATKNDYPVNNMCAVGGKTKIENGSYVTFKRCPESPKRTTKIATSQVTGKCKGNSKESVERTSTECFTEIDGNETD